MKPILFAPSATEYDNNGIGVLVDVGYCTVTEERNGKFELELQYPVNGNHYSDLAVDCQILAKPNASSNPQAFRIYRISKPMNGVVTVSAEHISYQLSSILVSPFSASGVVDALQKIKSKSIGVNPFTFTTDKTTIANMSNNIPTSARALLGGVSGSVLDVYAGEFEFDNFTVKLHQNRGEDNGVTIAYAKNLTGVKCDERLDGVVTGAIAYWSAETDGIKQVVYSDLQTIQTELSFSRNIVVDCSSEFDEAPTKSTLNTFALDYVNSHKNLPYFSVSVEFVNLGDTEEYKQYKGLYRVNLCDTVTIKHPLYGIDVKAKVVKTVFDSVNEKYEKIEIGEIAANISDTIAAQKKEIVESRVEIRGDLEKAIIDATNAITGNSGGYVVLYPPRNPQEILILDEPTVEEATNVWRWNSSGLGHSSNGFDGDYTTAITADGKIVADFITAGTMSANRIRAGVLKSISGLSSWDLSTGLFETISTKTFHAEQYSEADITRLQQIIIGQIEATSADFEKYDFYLRGKFTSLYLRIIQKMLLGFGDFNVQWRIILGTSIKADMTSWFGDEPSEKTWINSFEAGTKGISISDKRIDGFIVSEGSNYNWDWRIWSDGEAECWGKYDITVSQWNQWGALYIARLNDRIDYPISFLSAPNEHVSCRCANWAMMIMCEPGGSGGGNNTETQTAKYSAVRATSISTETQVTLDLYVYGTVAQES